MSKILLPVLLALSLAANLWFALARSAAEGNSLPRPAAAPGPAPGDERGPAASDARAKTTATNTAAPFVWPHSRGTDADLRQVAAAMRAAGFPPEIVVRFVGEMLREHTSTEIAQLPFWQLLAPGRDTRKRQAAAVRELLRRQEEILGPAGAPVATLDPIQRRLDYGALGDAQVAALLRIDRDYDELRADLSGAGGSVAREDFAALQKSYADLERERIADVAAVLSPEEFAEWERRKSPVAERIGWTLRELTIDEDEYAAVFAIEKARSPHERSFVGSLGPGTPEVFAYMDQIRVALGDERASTYLKTANFAYGMVARFAEKQPGITAAKTYELYRLQSEAQSAAAPDPSGAPRSGEALRTRMAEFNARLEALLGPEAAAAYRAQGMGRLFSLPQPRPPASPPKG